VITINSEKGTNWKEAAMVYFIALTSNKPEEDNHTEVTEM
jgi:hypothetical protein